MEKIKKRIFYILKKMKKLANHGIQIIQDDTGLSVIELLLILVVNLTPQNRVWIA